MRKTRRIRKTAALFAAGGMMLQFGGCDFFKVIARSIPIGIGQTVGALATVAIPAGLLEGDIRAAIASFTEGLGLGGN